MDNNKYVFPIPQDVIDAARKVEKFFAENNIKDWAFMGIRNRDSNEVKPLEIEKNIEPCSILVSSLDENDRELDFSMVVVGPYRIQAPLDIKERELSLRLAKI